MRKESHLGSRREAQAGFTLIEMSIVLVIIGLIVGGVLKGQELIDGARQKSTISQVDSFRVAVSTFQDKYNALPGDFDQQNILPGITAATDVGDGNGLIQTAATGIAITGDASAATTENQKFWAHLSAANMVGSISPTVGVGAFGTTLPQAKFTGAGFSVVYATVGTPAVTDNFFRLHRTAGAAPTGVFSGRQVSEIDQKYDDRNAVTGQIQQFISDTTNCNSAAGVYVAGNNVQGSCSLAFRF